VKGGVGWKKKKVSKWSPEQAKVQYMAESRAERLQEQGIVE
jgi:hypothetical protein